MARDYRKMKAWQLADQLALLVYKATERFPNSEVWRLTFQMRRSAVSAAADVVERSARNNRNEYLGRVELLHQVCRRIGIFGHQNLSGIMGEGSGRFENTSRVDFLYGKVWGLKSEIQCLN